MMPSNANTTLLAAVVAWRPLSASIVCDGKAVISRRLHPQLLGPGVIARHKPSAASAKAISTI
jgi:hypothetical protein